MSHIWILFHGEEREGKSIIDIYSNIEKAETALQNYIKEYRNLRDRPWVKNDEGEYWCGSSYVTIEKHEVY